MCSDSDTDLLYLQPPKNPGCAATPPASKRPLDRDVAASIADALMDDSGPDLDPQHAVTFRNDEGTGQTGQ